MTIRGSWWFLLAPLLGACAARHVDLHEAPGASVAGFPLTAQSEDAIRAWLRAHGNARDHSLDLHSAAPYLETVLDADAPVQRLGFFLHPDSWKLRAIVYWLRRSEPAPPVGELRGTWWGVPVHDTGTPETGYAPGAHAVIRWIDRDFILPAKPRVALPADIALKTPTRTFHRTHLYAVDQGRIWFKRNPSHEGHLGEPWRLLGDGLPAPSDPKIPFERPRQIVSLSADADDLLAVSDTGRVYLCTRRSTSLTSVDGWSDGWGFPGKRPLHLEGREVGARALAIGRRAEDALWFEDAIGNQHHFGLMGTTTLHALHANGQELLVTDNGLPNDFSRGLCGPQDGRFVAEGMSTSASAIFLIDRFGRMVTRFDDYDLNGGTPNFEYTYRSTVRPDDRGEDFLTSQTPYFLPLVPWRWHAPPALTGSARLGRTITILQTGSGNAARELRVEGRDPGGMPGYFHKGIEEDAWQFTATIEPPGDASLLGVEDVRAGAADFAASGGRLEQSAILEGHSQRGILRGTITAPPTSDGGMGRALPVELDWNPTCPPATVKVSVDGAGTFDATLHTVDLWNPVQRRHPGHDGTPLFLLGTLVLPDAVLTDQRREMRAAVDLLRPYHQETFALLVALDGEHLSVRSLPSGPGRRHPLEWELIRADAPEVLGTRRLHPGLSAVTHWIRQGDLEAPATWLRRPEADDEARDIAELRAEREQTARVLAELRALHLEHERNRAEVEQFKPSVQLAFSVLPLGRMRSLLELVSLQTLDAPGSLVGSEAAWQAAATKLATRVSELEEHLARLEAALRAPR